MNDYLCFHFHFTHRVPRVHLHVFLASSATDLALFVEEVEHGPQDGQQQDADDDDCNDDTAALWWRRQHTTTGLLTIWRRRGCERDDGIRAESRLQERVRQAVQHSPVCVCVYGSSGQRPEKKIAALASFR